MAAMMLKIWGKRYGGWLVPYEGQNFVTEKRVTPGHIVEMKEDADAAYRSYLECVGFQDDLLLQPRFKNVTLEIEAWEAAMLADYENTIADFEALTGRL